MRDKHYKTLISVVKDYLDDTIIYFISYNAQFKKTAKEIKSRAHGGYEIAHLTKEFEKEVNYKCIELLEKIETLFINSGRKLSPKQYNDLINICTKKFNAIVNSYCSAFREEFENIETVESSFKTLNENITCKINNYIRAFKLMSDAKINKDRLWTVWGIIVSAILSIIAIAVSLICD